jgi:sulfite exporter TauE/SafE
MIDPTNINGMGAAFVAGLVTSVHCVGMCGPIACILSPKVTEKWELSSLVAAYNLARVCSITLVGLFLGWVGRPLLQWFNWAPLQVLPWLLVFFFLLIASGMEQRLPKPKFLSRMTLKWSMRLSRLPGIWASLMIGFLTPLLPCGPLYLIFSLAMVSGSALQGAELLLAFGIGTIPLLFSVQASFVVWQKRLSPVWIRRIQRGFALVMAAMLIWRLRAGLGVGGPEIKCPFCH